MVAKVASRFSKGSSMSQMKEILMAAVMGHKTLTSVQKCGWGQHKHQTLFLSTKLYLNRHREEAWHMAPRISHFRRRSRGQAQNSCSQRFGRPCLVTNSAGWLL